MKKKLLYSLSSIILFSGTIFANQEANNPMQMVNITSMPTDEEIMQTISKFNFDKTQQEYLFKETKKRLEDLYNNKNYAPLIEGQNSQALQEAIENNTSIQPKEEYIKIEEVEEAKEEIKNEVQPKPKKQKSKRVKKYTNHAPLTRGHARRESR